jgi:hypothetical protein
VHAGVVRVLAQAPVTDASVLTIAGVAFPLCHSKLSESPGPASNHDCCDQCALCAAVALPGLRDLWIPASFVVIERSVAVAQTTPLARWMRTPRQSQAPPLA